MGERGAKRLIALNEQQSGIRADLAFPDAAKANRNVFYHTDGRAKTVGEVHAWAMGEHDASPQRTQSPQIAIASAAPPSAGSMPESNPRSVEEADGQFGITVRGSRFVFANDTHPSDASAFPRSPLNLSAGLLDIFAAAFAAPSVARRQG